jgi:hypothetical protein
MGEVSIVEPRGIIALQDYDNRTYAGGRGLAPTVYSISDLAYAVDNEIIGFSEDFPANFVDVTRAKAWSKLKNTQVNFGQNYGERKQTADLVVANLGRMVHGLKTLRKNPAVLKDIAKGANKVVEELPNWWLEVVFGWKPLISDIHGALTELDNRDSSGWKVTVKATSKRSGKYTGVFLPGAKGGNPQPQAFCDADREIFHGCKVRIDAVPSNDSLVKAAQLGLTNPLSLAWELMPWSFAIDWCFPIGQYFDNLDAPLGWEILGMSTSCITRTKFKAQGRDYPLGNGYIYRSDWSGRKNTVILNRDSHVVYPYEIVPHLKDPFSSKQRVGTMLALLGQLLGRNPRSFH